MNGGSFLGFLYEDFLAVSDQPEGLLTTSPGIADSIGSATVRGRRKRKAGRSARSLEPKKSTDL
jgi:hypothetical protein